MDKKKNLYILLEKSEPSFPQEQGSIIVSLRSDSPEAAINKMSELLPINTWICGKCEQEKNPHEGDDLLIGHCRYCPKYSPS